MKTIIFFSLALIFTANSAPAPVLDIDGKYLRTRDKYFVMPAARDGENGGLLSVDFNKKPCPVGIAQSRNDENGLPVTFTPANPKKGVIRLSTDVNIKFSGSTGCNESYVWKLDYDDAMREYAVMVGGVEGNPGPETLDNWFKIKKTKDGYKFVFCPSVCKDCRFVCMDVGIVVAEGGAQRLVFSKHPASFVFFHTY